MRISDGEPKENAVNNLGTIELLISNGTRGGSVGYRDPQLTEQRSGRNIKALK
jgi:hypothetical protein